VQWQPDEGGQVGAAATSPSLGGLVIAAQAMRYRGRHLAAASPFPVAGGRCEVIG
jgi:hypothetical protein